MQNQDLLKELRDKVEKEGLMLLNLMPECFEKQAAILSFKSTFFYCELVFEKEIAEGSFTETLDYGEHSEMGTPETIEEPTVEADLNNLYPPTTGLDEPVIS